MNWSRVYDWCLAGMIVGLILAGFFRPYDSTDDIAAGERSGLALYVDHATGCHYIRAGMFTTLVPRMDSTGQHVCWEVE